MPIVPPCTTRCVPFISQIRDMAGELSCQRMSASPSPVKSRWPTIDQKFGTCWICDAVAGFASRSSARSPTSPSTLRQRMSLFLSPLKSMAAG